jgi:hypothetical protein
MSSHESIMTQSRLTESTGPRFNWRLWLQWLLATVVGYLWAATIATQLYSLGSYVINLIAPTPYRFDSSRGWVLVPEAAIGLTVVALFQWLVLRHYLGKASWRQWVGANVLGYLGGLLGSLLVLLVLSPGLRGFPVGGQVDLAALGVSLLIAAGAGATLGALAAWPQWRILRPYLRDTDLWVWTNAAAWGSAGMALLLLQIGVALLTYQLATQSPHIFINGDLLDAATVIGSGLVMGVTVGAITGGTLVRLVGVDNLNRTRE